VRLTNSSSIVYYARTFNWSSTSVMTGNRPVSTEFTLPANLTAGTYSLVAVANGNASDPIQFTTTIWRGLLSADWDTTTLNWLKSNAPSNYNQGDFVIFDDTLIGSPGVNLTTALTPSGIFFNNNSASYVLAGPGSITGPGGVTKNGTGTATLAGTGGDSFNGNLTVNGGTLILDNMNATLTGSVFIGANSVLQCGSNDSNGNLPAGNVTNNGVLIFNQTSDVTVGGAISGNGAVTKNGPNMLTLTASNTWRGTTALNGGMIALAGSGSISSSTNIVVTAGTLLAATNRPDGTVTLASGQTLRGSGAIEGSLVAGVGSTFALGDSPAAAGAFTVSSNVTLQGVSSMKIDPASGTNDVLYAFGVTFGGVLNLTNLSSALSPGNTVRLFVATNYAGAFSSIAPIAPGPGLAWDTNNLALNGTLGVIYTPGATWQGTVDGTWDTITTNWVNGGIPSNYNPGDMVTFDDSVIGTTNVVVSTVVSPASVSFNNSLSNYVISGTGSLSGPFGVVKNNPGTVMLAESGGDNFTGGVTVNTGALILDNPNSAILGNTTVDFGGTLQCGNNDGFGNLPSGNVLLNGRLIFNRTNNLSIGNLISGFGRLIKTNTDIVTLTRNNLNWTGAVTIAQGTLQLASVNALGRGTNVQIAITNGGTLDLNSISGTNSAVVSGTGVSGNGVIVNNTGLQAAPGLAFLTLAGNTTIGGSGRWDLRPAAANPDTASATFAALSTGGQPYSLTKTGANFIGLVSATVDPKLANVTVQSGTLDLEGNLTGIGNPANPLTVFTNATLQLLNLAAGINKVVVLNDGATLLNANGANILNGPIVLATNAPVGVGNCTFNIGGSYLWSTDFMSGRGNLIKIGSSILYMSGANTYVGSTLIKAGTLALWVDGSIYSSTNINIVAGATLNATTRSDTMLTLTNGQTLQGGGALSGILLARSGSTISPGSNSVIATLNVSSNVTLQGTTVMKLNAASLVNDVLRAYTFTPGGTLRVTNISATPLAAGMSFRLFIANNYAASSFSSISPPTPGIGLAWNTNSMAVLGTLSVVSLPRPGITSMSLSGTNLVLTGTNAVAGRPYLVLSSTDVTLPLNQWTPLSTNTFGAAGNFSITATNAVDPLAAQKFYALQVQ
jgi:autotransporter-associated beta strand protein